MAHYFDYASASPSVVAADLGTTFAQVRLAHNLSQVALAKQAGVSARTVKRLESGQGATLDTVIRLMQALGLSNHLKALLPDPEIQPVQLIARAGRQRQRASHGTQTEQAGWTWDEDLIP